jgi:hypothetical protein
MKHNLIALAFYRYPCQHQHHPSMTFSTVRRCSYLLDSPIRINFFNHTYSKSLRLSPTFQSSCSINFAFLLLELFHQLSQPCSCSLSLSLSVPKSVSNHRRPTVPQVQRASSVSDVRALHSLIQLPTPTSILPRS